MVPRYASQDNNPEIGDVRIQSFRDRYPAQFDAFAGTFQLYMKYIMRKEREALGIRTNVPADPDLQGNIPEEAHESSDDDIREEAQAKATYTAVYTDPIGYPLIDPPRLVDGTETQDYEAKLVRSFLRAHYSVYSPSPNKYGSLTCHRLGRSTIWPVSALACHQQGHTRLHRCRVSSGWN